MTVPKENAKQSSLPRQWCLVSGAASRTEIISLFTGDVAQCQSSCLPDKDLSLAPQSCEKANKEENDSATQGDGLMSKAIAVQVSKPSCDPWHPCKKTQHDVRAYNPSQLWGGRDSSFPGAHWWLASLARQLDSSTVSESKTI